EDVLRGLKKFKRLAKQDMLAGPKTANPGFWTAQAEARRLVYGELTDWVEHLGVEAAYEKALKAYAALPLSHAAERAGGEPEPGIAGREQAYEMFFTLLGIDKGVVTRAYNSRRRHAPRNPERMAATH